MRRRRPSNNGDKARKGRGGGRHLPDSKERRKRRRKLYFIASPCRRLRGGLLTYRTLCSLVATAREKKIHLLLLHVLFSFFCFLRTTHAKRNREVPLAVYASLSHDCDDDEDEDNIFLLLPPLPSSGDDEDDNDTSFSSLLLLDPFSRREEGRNSTREENRKVRLHGDGRGGDEKVTTSLCSFLLPFIGVPLPAKVDEEGK